PPGVPDFHRTDRMLLVSVPAGPSRSSRFDGSSRTVPRGGPGTRRPPMLAATLSAAQHEFVIQLPAVENAARWAFRHRLRLRWQDFEEALAETRAAAWSAWVGLLATGKDPVQVGVHAIAGNAARYVRNGRRVGNRNGGGRSVMDVHNRKARVAGCYRI